MSEKQKRSEQSVSTSGIGGFALKIFNRSKYDQAVRDQALQRAEQERQDFIEANKAAVATELADQIEAVARINTLLGVKPKEEPGKYNRYDYNENFVRRGAAARTADGGQVRLSFWKQRDSDVLTLTYEDAVITELSHLRDGDHSLPPEEVKARRTELLGTPRRASTYMLREGKHFVSFGASDMDRALQGNFTRLDRGTGTRPFDPAAYERAPGVSAEEPLGLLRDNWDGLCANAGIDPSYEGPQATELATASSDELFALRHETLIPEGSKDTTAYF